MTTLTAVIIAAAVTAAAAALILLMAYICAKKTFGVPKFKDKNLYYFLPGEQFDVYREELTRLTKEALALPCEDVYITSFDGDASSVISNGYTLYVNGTALSGTK